MKKALKIIISLLLAIILIAVSYFAYVFIAYHRIGDKSLEIKNSVDSKAKSDTVYTALSWNIGFGAYTADYDFFMDGGKQSWAKSKEDLKKNMKDISDRIAEQNADFIFTQEVDFDSTRTYHRDERKDLIDSVGKKYTYTFAQNYDSPFLLYPFYQPHGANKSGLLTFSDCKIKNADRVELPVESSVFKILDLDRCYSKQFVETENGKMIVLFNMHLSAYSSDPSIATNQLEILLSDMKNYRDKGYYCIAGGDFNKDLIKNSSDIFGKPDKEYSWAKPIPEGVLDKYEINLVAPLDEAKPVPSCRNPDSPYHLGQYILTVDGFLVSDNVSVIDSSVLDYSFAYSDHNPVKMNFKLN